MTALGDLAHIGHVELLTPTPQESLRFFVERARDGDRGAREGQSVFLRGWGDYQRYSLKLTEARAAGHRARRDARLGRQERCAGASRRSKRPGAARAGSRATSATARPTASRDPDGHPFELYYEPERYDAARAPAPGAEEPAAALHRPRRGGQAPRPRQPAAADVAANRRFADDVLGYRLYERIELDDGSEAGAWLSLSIAAHELIYVADAHGVGGRLHHLAFWVDTREELLRAADLFLDADVPIEAAPSKHAVAQGFFLYVFEPGGNRVEVTSGGYFVYDPDYEPIVWTQAERARGQAWGVRTVESFHSYGTPDVSGDAVGPPIPPTSTIPGG